MSSEAILAVKSTIAQAESKSISQNMRLGARMRMKNGTFITNKVPFGYDYIDQKHIINNEKAEIVRRIFNEYLNGYGIATITLRLNAEKVPHTENSKMWHTCLIRNVLTNEKYMGDTMMQKSYRLDDIPYTKKINHGEIQRYYRYNTHEPIIDRETFMRVQRIMECKGVPHTGKPPIAEKPIFHQYIQCGHCGATFKRKMCNGKTYWICYYRSQNKLYCEAHQISEKVIMDAFLHLYNKLRANHNQILTPAITQLTDIKMRLRQNNTRIGELDRQIAELNEQNLVITRLKTKGFMDNNDYLEQRAEIDGQIKKLRDERRIQLRTDDDDDTLEQLTALSELIESGDEYMKHFDGEMFACITEKIIATNETLTFKLLGGLELTERIGGTDET